MHWQIIEQLKLTCTFLLNHSSQEEEPGGANPPWYHSEETMETAWKIIEESLGIIRFQQNKTNFPSSLSYHKWFITAPLSVWAGGCSWKDLLHKEKLPLSWRLGCEQLREVSPSQQKPADNTASKSTTATFWGKLCPHYSLVRRI